MRKFFPACFLFFSVPVLFAQPGKPDKYTLLDSALNILRLQNPAGWSFSRYGSRIVMTRNDSVLVATSFSEYKPGRAFTESLPVKYKYQLFIDFYEAAPAFTGSLRKQVNDSIDRLIRSFDKKKYGRGEHYIHFEATELLRKMKLEEPGHLINFDIRFSDNCAGEWILYERKDAEHLPFEPPTPFQRHIEEMKLRVTAWFRDWGI